MKVRIVAASADACDTAAKTVEKFGLKFSVGCGLNAREVAAVTGAFFHEMDGYLHATGFIVNPDGKIMNAVYSTLAIGRLVPEDCLGLIKYMMSEHD